MRKSTNVIDLAAAVAAAQGYEAAALTLPELIDAWSRVTLDGSETRLRKWTAAFPTTSAWDVTSEQLEAAARYLLEQGRKPSAINRDLSALGSAYKWAKSKRLSPRGFRSPTLDIKRMPEDIRRVELTNQQVDALRARARAFRDQRFGVFVELLLDTGARKSELLQRRWCDVNLEKGEIHCQTTKTGVPRVLYFREQTAELMRRVYRRREPDELLFEGRVPGRPVDYKKAWSTATEEIGLPDLRIHDVRHAAAARLLRSGVTAAVAAQIMGHSSLVLQRRYGHLETAWLKNAQQLAWQGQAPATTATS